MSSPTLNDLQKIQSLDERGNARADYGLVPSYSHAKVPQLHGVMPEHLRPIAG